MQRGAGYVEVQAVRGNTECMRMRISRRVRKPRVIIAALAGVAVLTSAGIGLALQTPITDSYVVIAQNDLGMHCMQDDFSQMMILPPFNTVRAQVIRRGHSPDITTSDVTVRYEFTTNTHSADKTNFWRFAPQLLGANLDRDVGLAGFGMSGTMARDSAHRSFTATGIPVTPIDDDGKENPYPLIHITARLNNTVVAQTQAVVPVSWEMSCNLCHAEEGKSVATNILEAHDRLHATDLIHQQPVMCASCHSDNALGTPGTPGVPSLSSAMHGAHASRMNTVTMDNACYACHPGQRTNCQRDVHAANNVTCTQCHGTMEQVANPSRNPWAQEPRCDSCHSRPGFEFEQPNTLFRDATGHGGVQCITCHGSPHVVGSATTEKDNMQAVRMQQVSGTLSECTVCHIQTPTDPFPHRGDDD